MTLKHFLYRYIRTTIPFLGVLSMLIYSNNAFGQNPTILTSGTSFTVPTNTKAIKVEAWGGGGSGGNDRGGGGGGGSYARSSIAGPFSPSYPYTIGAGGNFSNGGTTSFGTGPFLVSAGGGVRGNDGASGGAGGAGGLATIGNETIINGSPGIGSSGNSGGNGGNAAGNGGTGGALGGNTISGNPGNSPGGGGGGSGRNNFTLPIGGLGQIRISYIALTSATNTDAQTVCSGSPITSITYSVPVGSTVTIPALPSSGVSFTYNSGTGTITISGNPTALISYTVNVTTSYGVTLNTSGTITVNPTPVIPAQTATVCSGSAFTVSPTNGSPTAATIVPAGTSYTWTVVDNPNITGESAQGTGHANISQTLTNTSNSIQTVTYTVTPTSGATGNCVGTPFTITVTVNPTPVIPAQTATVCSGSAFTVSPTNGSPTAATIVPAGTSYTWTVVDNPNITGESAQGTAQANISQTLTNTSNVAQTVTYTVIPSAGTCPGASFPVTVTVNPSPVIPVQTATVCSGSAFTVSPTNGSPTAATIIPAGTSYTWTVVDNPNITGESAQGTAQANISQSLTNTTNVAQTIIYTVSPVSGTCTGATFTVTVTVNPIPAITNITTVACSGAAFTIIPANGTNGVVPAGTTYSWSAPTVTSGMTGAATGSGASNITGTLSNPTINPQTATYTVTPTFGSCTGTPFSVTVTVNPIPAPTNMTNTVCSGAPFTVTPVNSTNGFVPVGTTYSWSVPAVTGGMTGGAAASGASSITGTLSNPTISPQTATYTVTPTVGSCPGAPFTVTVTVNPTPVVSNMTAAVCTGTSFAATPANGTNGLVPVGTTFSWSAPTVTGGMTGGAAGSGASNITGTLINSTNSPQTATYSVTPVVGTCTGATFTVTVTVNPIPAITNITTLVCTNTAFSTTPLNSTNGFVPLGTTYSWTVPTVTGGMTGGATGSGTTSITGTLTNPTNSPQTATYTVTPAVGSCAGAPFTVTVTVNPTPLISVVDDQPTGKACVDTPITYTTQSGQSNYVWSIPGQVAGTDYSVISGGTSTSDNVVVRWLSAGSKSISVNYTDPNGCGTPTAATSNLITVQKNTVTPVAPPIISSCFSNRTITSVNHHTTTLATGIANDGVLGANGLVSGLSATWSGGTITISGTVAGTVAPGIYPYSIPLTGGCGTVAATGVIDVQPEFKLTTISSVSPSSTGGVATITIEGNPTLFTNGSYVLTYSLGLSNAGSETRTVIFTNGRAVFTTLIIASEDLTSLTISQIRKSTDACFVPVTENNVTFFGIKAATFTTSGTFFVPAGIFEITIKVWSGGGGGGNNTNGAGGGGGGYSVVTIPVTPGEPIGIFIGQGGNAQTPGGDSWATRDSSPPNAISNSLVYAKGGAGASGSTPGTHNPALPSLTSSGWGNSSAGVNGQAGNGGNGGKGGGATGGAGGAGGSASGNDTGRPGFAPGGGGGGSKGNSLGGRGGNGLVLISFSLPPTGPCFRVIDDGSISGTTIIEFTCNTTWTAPEGPTRFQTTVGGAGGGGGFGSGSGGGGAGQILHNLTYSTTNPAGFPAGTSFAITVGQGGLGATSLSQKGGIGGISSFSGMIDGTSISVTADGGGGGGSRGNGLGLNGASGGGGAAIPTPVTNFNGGNGIASVGSAGGRGDAAGGGAHAGGGGGGIATLGQNGQGDGAGQGKGGDGGHGRQYSIPGLLINYGSGGGGISNNFNGVNKFNGEGGKIFDLNINLLNIRIGGDGNQDNATSIGQQGQDLTGSGGGAGFAGGGRGGKGVVYIYYDVFRILPVEFLYFNAIYQNSNRSGELKWGTAKEWETSHFEIERSLNDTRNWTKVGEVTGKGYSDVPVEYSFTDLTLPASGGNIFYRLKQVDLDADFAYSVTRAIQVEGLEGSTSWISYPNPSAMRSSITVDLLDRSGYADESILIRISDARGIFESYSVSSPDEVSAVVNSYLEEARPGLHILQLIWGNKSEQLKLIRN